MIWWVGAGTVILSVIGAGLILTASLRGALPPTLRTRLLVVGIILIIIAAFIPPGVIVLTH